MHTLALLLQLIVAMGGVSLESLSVTGAPFDISTGWAEVPLREPLTANTGNPRLIIYLRNLSEAGLDREHVLQQLPLMFPPSSLEAEAINHDGKAFRLKLTGYSFFRGLPGLVLEEDAISKGETFYKLRIRGTAALHDVTMIWLDSLGRSRPE